MDQPFLCRKTNTETEKTRQTVDTYSLPAALIHLPIGGDSTMKREKVSPEEWRERLDRAVNAKRGRWRTLPRAIASSRAFAELSKSGLIVVLAMLDNLTYQGKVQKKSRQTLCNAADCLWTTTESS